MNDLLTPKDFIEVGYIGGLYGYEGQLRFTPKGRLGTSVKPPEFLYFIENGMYVPRFVSTWDPGQSLIGFERYPNREKARELTDQVVFLRKRDLPEQTVHRNFTDEFSWDLLEGFQILNINTEQVIGTITMVEEYPGGWMAGTRIENRQNEVLIPLAPQLIHDLDPDQNIVYMDLPDGLLDL